MKEDLYVVRLYDGFDNEWIDVSEAVSKDGADRIWNEKTKNGTEKTKFDDIDYYRIFPADTVMFFFTGGKGETWQRLKLLGHRTTTSFLTWKMVSLQGGVKPKKMIPNMPHLDLKFLILK